MSRSSLATETMRVASLLLQYPDAELHAGLDDIRTAVAAMPESRQRVALERFLATAAGRSLRSLQEEYVATFDVSRRTSLYLTHPEYGDRRERGMALLRLKRRYAAAGLRLDGPELPDFLPAMLEFAWAHPDGRDVLREHRPAVELLAGTLRAAHSPFVDVVDAVLASLPRLEAAQRALLRRMAQSGPPEEAVGLEPFAPPDIMPWAASGAPR